METFNCNCNCKWRLVEGDILAVELTYEVLGHPGFGILLFRFVVIKGGIASPQLISTFFRNYFVLEIFRGVGSQKFVWYSTKISIQSCKEYTRFEGRKCKVQTDLDIQFGFKNKLKVTFIRYNSTETIFLYGIRENLECAHFANALSKLSDEIKITPDISVSFSGLCDQVTKNNFLIGITCNKIESNKVTDFYDPDFYTDFDMNEAFYMGGEI